MECLSLPTLEGEASVETPQDGEPDALAREAAALLVDFMLLSGA